jgi:hypothetical protein
MTKISCKVEADTVKNAADIAIAAMLAARAEHRLVFAKGSAQAEWTAVRKANDAIGAARMLAFQALGTAIFTICNDALIDRLREHSLKITQEIQ